MGSSKREWEGESEAVVVAREQARRMDEMRAMFHA